MREPKNPKKAHLFRTESLKKCLTCLVAGLLPIGQSLAGDVPNQSARGTVGVGDGLVASLLPISPDVPNQSTRGIVGTGENVMILSFVAEGAGVSQFLLFGIGPTLAASGVSGVLADPKIRLANANNGAVVSSNDNWKNHPSAGLTAQFLTQQGLTISDLDAAMVLDLGAGRYSLVVEGADGGTGVALGGVQKVLLATGGITP